jgi:flagellar FliL protein
MAEQLERRMSTTTATATKAAKGAAGADDGGEAPKKSKKKLVIAAVLVVVIAAAAWFFLLGGKGGGEEKVEEPVPGAVLVVEPININLADGHYLKFGFGLQLIEKVAHEPDSSQALALAIDQLSGASMKKLSDPEGRRKAMEKLAKSVEKAYHHDVIDLYPTTFVMQ